MSTEAKHFDALGNEIQLGKRYGYSRNASGHSFTTIGNADYCKNGKVRLVLCTVNRWLYGEAMPSNDCFPSADISINSFMVFPVA